jgi:hypothetical protein
MGLFSTFDVGGCGCATCPVTFFVTACGSFGLQGATVNVWKTSAMATLVATGNTDSSGYVTLDVGTAGAYYQQVVTNTPRLKPPANISTTYTCNGSVTAITTLGTGYGGCFNGCALPAASTLHSNHPGLTCGTMVFGSGGSGGWNDGCIELLGNLTCTTADPPCTAVLNSCPPSLSITVTDAAGSYAITE